MNKPKEQESRFAPVATESLEENQEPFALHQPLFKAHLERQMREIRRDRERMRLMRKPFSEDELVTMAENRELRQLIIAVTGDCLLTRDEYLQIRKIITGTCERCECVGSDDDKADLQNGGIEDGEKLAGRTV